MGPVIAAQRPVGTPLGAGAVAAGDISRLLHVVGGDRLLLGELIDIFLSTYPHQVERIRRAIGDTDWRAVQETAHSMKGSTGSLTAARAAGAAGDLERLARAGDTTAMGAALERLEAELATLHEWLVDTMNGVNG
jgi:HPt (histidine-containing phosphotransfer) domain-containing protein